MESRDPGVQNLPHAAWDERPPIRQWYTPPHGGEPPVNRKEVLPTINHYPAGWSSRYSYDSVKSTSGILKGRPYINRMWIFVIIAICVVVIVGIAIYFAVRTSTENKTTEEEFPSVRGEMRLPDWTYNTAMTDKNTDSFKNSQNRFCNLVKNVMLGSPIASQYHDCLVNRFSQGSVHVFYTMRFEANVSSDTYADAAGWILKAIKDEQFGATVVQQSVSFSVDPTTFVTITRKRIDTEVEVENTITLNNATYTPALGNHTSEEFQTEAKSFCDNLMLLHMGTTLANQILGCQVMSFSQGSVVCVVRQTVQVPEGETPEETKDKVNMQMTSSIPSNNYFSQREAELSDATITHIEHTETLSSQDVNTASLASCAGTNGGCTDICTEDSGQVMCSCFDGYVISSDDAKKCINIDDCSPNPCVNGKCIDKIKAHTCQCNPGYEGVSCTINTNNCMPSLCQNGGTCTDGVDTYTCDCVNGFEGDNCETNTDDCMPSHCLNGGTCTDGVDTYTCDCVSGFEGDNCETNIDNCSPEPCQNEGTCIDGVDEYACNCSAGFEGTNCETNINECSPNPCQNGGTCIDGIDKYMCNCATGSEGDNCENPCLPSVHFTCGDGTCIPLSSVCDWTSDCKDRSDEKQNCICTDSQFQCADGVCLSLELYCDDRFDCDDNSDEIEGCTCNTYQFECDDICHPIREKCDSIAHCSDLTDEMDCTNITCPMGFKACDSGQCIYASRFCDGRDDCADKSDEDCIVNCDFTCANDKCVPQYQVCDYVNDCGDNSDEKNCDCRLDQFVCQDGSCIQQEFLCDGRYDCSDQGDEMNCGGCDENQFLCPSTNQCMSKGLFCNGNLDCASGSDEFNCVFLGQEHAGEGGRTYYEVEALSGIDEGTKLPVCSDNWSKTLSDQLCSELSKGQSEGFIEVDTTSTEILVYSNSDAAYIIGALAVGSCSSGKVVAIRCQELECGQRKIPEAIAQSFVVGGQTSPAGQWPWQAALYDAGGFICGGTLIDSSWVITAGHCLLNKKFSDVSVKLGSTKSSEVDIHSRTFRARYFYTHEKLRFDKLLDHYEYDIALIKLESRAVYNNYIQPACLPHRDDYRTMGGRCWISGWGYLRGHGFTPEDLQEARLNLMSYELCRNLTSENIPDIEICAGYESGYVSGCQGDSGSPLSCEDHNGIWHVLGAVSWGSPNCRGQPTVFANVHYFLDWILNIMTKYA